MGVAPSTLAAILAASASPPTPVAEWRFAEGSGTSVADQQGTYPINLSLPTTPNATWTAAGISLASGLIQTPSITGIRTVAILCRTNADATTGFIISGANGASGDGMMQDYVGATATVYHAAAGVVSPLWRGSNAARTNAFKAWSRGGWTLIFLHYPSAYNGALGFGGRHSTTTSRCASFEVAWAAVYSGVLTDAERGAVFAHVAGMVTPRGVYIRAQDCPTQANWVLLSGQSNADGRALISNMLAGDSSRTYTKTKISLSAASTSPATLTIGTGHNQQSTTMLGPELSFAAAYEDAGQSRDLYISKTVLGGTYLAPPGVGGSASSTSWSVNVDVANGGLFRASLMDWIEIWQAAANAGVGLVPVAWLWAQGEQDATSTATSATYAAELADLWAQVQALTGVPRVVVTRTGTTDPAANATAAAEVRAAQAAFVAARSGVATLLDADGYSLLADNVHYSAAGQKAHGLAQYAAAFP